MNNIQLFQFIVIESAKYCKVPTAEIYRSTRGTVEVVRARWLVMLTGFVHLQLSANQIGRLLGRTHATVLHGIAKARELPRMVAATDVIFAVVESKKTSIIPNT